MVNETLVRSYQSKVGMNPFLYPIKLNIRFNWVRMAVQWNKDEVVKVSV